MDDWRVDYDYDRDAFKLSLIHKIDHGICGGCGKFYLNSGSLYVEHTLVYREQVLDNLSAKDALWQSPAVKRFPPRALYSLYNMALNGAPYVRRSSSSN